MRSVFPFLQWLPSYNKRFLGKDAVAGLTLGIVLIPQGMAYAMIAGLPPVYGLYASLVPVVIYALLGTSRQMAVGPVAMDSLLVAAALAPFATTGGENYVAMALLLAMMVGGIQIILGLLRMGFLVNFLSKPVISGFTSAAALIIIISQLKHLLGTAVERSNRFHEVLYNAAIKIPEINWVDFTIGLLGIVLIVLFKRWNRKIPGVLIVVVLGILVVYLFGLQSYGVKIVGSIPTGLPSFHVPVITGANLLELAPIALTLALIGYLEAISIGKSLEEMNGEETVNANQELIAIGASNFFGSLFQSYPVTGSFSRSAINDSSGAKTTVSLIICTFMVVVVLLFFTPLFYYLPNAILASIIMVSVVGLIDIGYPRSLWAYRKDELVILLLTFLTTLFIGITQGILFGVMISLLLMVYKSSKPHFAVLGKIEGSDYYKNIDRFGEDIEVRNDLLIVRFDSQLYFGNKNFFKQQLYKCIDAKGPNLNGIILNAEAINYIDSSAAQMLIRVIQDLHERDLKFYIAGAIGPARDIIFSSGIIDELSKECLFVQTKEAVDYFDKAVSPSKISAKIAYQSLRQR
ncbi:MAG: sodium-independent anion transporter [Pseudozobellia sp.]|nr:sodium-independent anion transporter [Pseudozobellia sp.]MBG50772.1 sodium-independent anion transporter [Pseudozobellia sp.]|tara:strand:- start:427891 stop:429618 length:1728 start_codon:yes stop_codon:yes gene_type:complete